MKSIASLPNTGPITAERDLGEFVDSSTPGAGDGSPLRQDWLNDMYYALRALLYRVGMSPDDSEEGISTSQIRDALVKNIRSLQTLDANTTFTQFFNDTDVYFTATANRTCDIQAGSNRVGNGLTIYNSASSDYTVVITYASGKTITLTREKFVTFKWTGAKWTVKKRSLIGQSAIVDFLDSNMIQKKGELLSRTTYAALWHHVSTNLSPVTDAAWLAGDVGNYSTGDGSTTFRTPDTRGLFPRFAGTNSIMKLADAVTYFNGGNARSVANDIMFGHWHKVGHDPASGGSAAAQMSTATQTASPTTMNNAYPSVRAHEIVSDGPHGTPRTGGETAPARVSYYDIVYFED